MVLFLPSGRHALLGKEKSTSIFCSKYWTHTNTQRRDIEITLDEGAKRTFGAIHQMFICQGQEKKTVFLPLKRDFQVSERDGFFS